MVAGLSVQDVVEVDVTIEPAAANFRNFGVGMIVGNSNVIDVQQRFRQYADIDGVEEDFGTTAPEFLAAQLFFSQEPQPSELFIGRWAETATNGLLHGGLLSATEQLLSNFTPITSGAMSIAIDGVPYAVTGMNFSQALNLNAIAAIVQTQLQDITSNDSVLCTWDPVNERFNVFSGTTGPASSVGPASPPAAQGNVAFTTNPAAASTLTLGGTAVSFVSSSPTGDEVLIGSSLALTLNNLQTFLNVSTDVNISKCTYDLVNDTLYIVNKTPGSSGDSFTLATTVSGATVSGATLAGGAGTDVSTVLGLTTAAGSFSVQGIAAESFLSAVVALDEASNGWYALIPASNPMPMDTDYIAAAQFIEGDGTSRTFWPTSSESQILNPDSTSDLFASLQTLGLNRTAPWYSTSTPYAGASAWGLGATINFEGENTTITWMWKQLPSVAAESLTETQAATLHAKNGNVFANYNNGVAITQFGTMSGGDYIDEIVDTDWLQNFVQTNVFNLFFDTATKIPQTDPGVHLIVNEVNASLAQAVINGTLAPGVWQGPDIGAINTGDTLPLGYYTYAPPVATQTQAARAARQSPPIQSACTLAGAVHTVSIFLNFTR